MDTLKRQISRTVAEAAKRNGVVWVSDEAKRLAERYSGEATPSEIAAALTREGLRSGVGLRIGEAAPGTAPRDAETSLRGSVTNP